MAQFIVRRVDDDVAVSLKRRARRNGRSTEEEIRQILRDAARDVSRAVAPLGSRIAARFSGAGLADGIPEVRQAARPADFEE